MPEKIRAGKNRTLSLDDGELKKYMARSLAVNSPVAVERILDKTVHGDIFRVAPFLPDRFVDLMFIDPPYNMDKRFNERRFKKTSIADYTSWIDGWLGKLIRLLKPTASVYICSDWRSSSAVETAARKYFKVRNRIAWEREKGRGALKNWKNCSEDVWFFTVGEKYTFNVDAVKLKRKVLAPYTDKNGAPKDWEKTGAGNYRLTAPSNLWTDVTVPFWSMPENTDHPTQKPEKLVAKIILASSNPGDVVFDPFLGSGTTSVVAKKLGRRFVGVESDATYCCFAEKRLAEADRDPSIQGYKDGVFWERNTLWKTGKS